MPATVFDFPVRYGIIKKDIAVKKRAFQNKGREKHGRFKRTHLQLRYAPAKAYSKGPCGGYTQPAASASDTSYRGCPGTDPASSHQLTAPERAAPYPPKNQRFRPDHCTEPAGIYGAAAPPSRHRTSQPYQLPWKLQNGRDRHSPGQLVSREPLPVSALLPERMPANPIAPVRNPPPVRAENQRLRPKSANAGEDV